MSSDLAKYFLNCNTHSYAIPAPKDLWFDSWFDLFSRDINTMGNGDMGILDTQQSGSRKSWKQAHYHTIAMFYTTRW